MLALGPANGKQDRQRVEARLWGRIAGIEAESRAMIAADDDDGVPTVTATGLDEASRCLHGSAKRKRRLRAIAAAVLIRRAWEKRCVGAAEAAPLD